MLYLQRPGVSTHICACTHVFFASVSDPRDLFTMKWSRTIRTQCRRATSRRRPVYRMIRNGAAPREFRCRSGVCARVCPPGMRLCNGRVFQRCYSKRNKYSSVYRGAAQSWSRKKILIFFLSSHPSGRPISGLCVVPRGTPAVFFERNYSQATPFCTLRITWWQKQYWSDRVNTRVASVYDVFSEASRVNLLNTLRALSSD